MLTGCGGDAATASNRIIVACGDDTAGVLVGYVIDSCETAEEQDAEAQQVGDCCGSNSQFALSTGDVDVAVVCPDAVQFLPDDGEGYYVAGTVTYDANLLVRKTPAETVPATIGYMVNRTNQVRLLQEKYGDEAELKQMYASGLSYALETEAVEAVLLDAMTELALEYPFERISTGEPASVMVVRRELLDDERFLNFIKSYNETVRNLEDEDELYRLLETYLGQDNGRTKEGVLSQWKEMGVTFGTIDL